MAHFDDLLEGNQQYASSVHDPAVVGKAARGVAVLTCIDSRIDPLAMLGLRVGDAKIFRNAGARVTDDALRSLVLAVNLLEVDRVCVVQHTDCAVARSTNAGLQEAITQRTGVDARDWDFLADGDQLDTLQADIGRLRACPLLPADLTVGGFVFDVHSGELIPHSSD